MNTNFLKDAKTELHNSNLGGSQELPAGVTPRRYEPAEGLSKHNARIHRESAYLDRNKSLPFTFSKPKKHPKPSIVMCMNCGHKLLASVNTIGVVCPSCNKFSKTSQININE